MTAEVRFGRWYTGEIFATSDDKVRLNEKGQELQLLGYMRSDVDEENSSETPREKIGPYLF